MSNRLRSLLSRLPLISQLAELRALRQRIADETRFSQTCLAYLDQVEPGLRHIRCSSRLYLVGVDTFSEVEYIWAQPADGFYHVPGTERRDVSGLEGWLRLPQGDGDGEGDEAEDRKELDS